MSFTHKYSGGTKLVSPPWFPTVPKGWVNLIRARSPRAASKTRPPVHATSRKIAVSLVTARSVDAERYARYVKGRPNVRTARDTGQEMLWKRLKHRVESYQNLKPGWDGYDARPPSSVAITNALAFIDVLRLLKMPPVWIEPSSDNSILLELKVQDETQEWDFYSDGEVAVLRERPGLDDVCVSVEPTPANFVKLILMLDAV